MKLKHCPILQESVNLHSGGPGEILAPRWWRHMLPRARVRTGDFTVYRQDLIQLSRLKHRLLIRLSDCKIPIKLAS